MFALFTIACLLGAAAAAPGGIGGLGLGPIAVAPVAVAAVDSINVPRYNFNYAVADPLTGDNKAQSEVRDGGVVRGSYSLAEPDGTIRVVDYAADPISGFNAVVKRIGSAVHPQKIIAPVVAKQIVAPVAAPIAVSPIGLGGYGLSSVGLGLSGVGLGLGGIGLAGVGLEGVGLGLGHH